jgi:hypothetical protein
MSHTYKIKHILYVIGLGGVILVVWSNIGTNEAYNAVLTQLYL